MAGIYQRDNLAQIYAANLERALARRDAYEKERAARVNSNVDAIKNGIRAVGTAVTYGLSEDPQARLAALEKEYQEAVAAEREEAEQAAHEADIAEQYGKQVAQRKAVNDYFMSEFTPYEKQVMDRKRFDNFVKANRAQNNYANAMLGRDMLGYYTTTPTVSSYNSIPEYSIMFGRRGR